MPHKVIYTSILSMSNYFLSIQHLIKARNGTFLDLRKKQTVYIKLNKKQFMTYKMQDWNILHHINQQGSTLEAHKNK